MAHPDRTAALHSEALDRALALAAREFRHTPRKGSAIPYLTHLLAVAALVGDYHGTEEEMIVAVLHPCSVIGVDEYRASYLAARPDSC